MLSRPFYPSPYYLGRNQPGKAILQIFSGKMFFVCILLLCYASPLEIFPVHCSSCDYTCQQKGTELRKYNKDMKLEHLNLHNCTETHKYKQLQYTNKYSDRFPQLLIFFCSTISWLQMLLNTPSAPIGWI